MRRTQAQQKANQLRQQARLQESLATTSMSVAANQAANNIAVAGVGGGYQLDANTWVRPSGVVSALREPQIVVAPDRFVPGSPTSAKQHSSTTKPPGSSFRLRRPKTRFGWRTTNGAGTGSRCVIRCVLGWICSYAVSGSVALGRPLVLSGNHVILIQPRAARNLTNTCRFLLHESTEDDVSQHHNAYLQVGMGIAKQNIPGQWPLSSSVNLVSLRSACRRPWFRTKRPVDAGRMDQAAGSSFLKPPKPPNPPNSSQQHIKLGKEYNDLETAQLVPYY